MTIVGRSCLDWDGNCSILLWTLSRWGNADSSRGPMRMILLVCIMNMSSFTGLGADTIMSVSVWTFMAMMRRMMRRWELNCVRSRRRWRHTQSSVDMWGRGTREGVVCRTSCKENRASKCGMCLKQFIFYSPRTKMKKTLTQNVREKYFQTIYFEPCTLTGGTSDRPSGMNGVGYGDRDWLQVSFSLRRGEPREWLPHHIWGWSWTNVGFLSACPDSRMRKDTDWGIGKWGIGYLSGWDWFLFVSHAIAFIWVYVLNLGKKRSKGQPGMVLTSRDVDRVRPPLLKWYKGTYQRWAVQLIFVERAEEGKALEELISMSISALFDRFCSCTKQTRFRHVSHPDTDDSSQSPYLSSLRPCLRSPPLVTKKSGELRSTQRGINQSAEENHWGHFHHRELSAHRQSNRP